METAYLPVFKAKALVWQIHGSGLVLVHHLGRIPLRDFHLASSRSHTTTSSMTPWIHGQMHNSTQQCTAFLTGRSSIL